MDLEIDSKLKDLFKKLPLEAKRKIVDYLNKQAENEQQKVQSVTPYNMESNKNHLNNSWTIKNSSNGSTVINTKKIKGNGRLAYLLNNYDKTKHYQWFDKWWIYEKSNLENKLSSDVEKIIENLIK